MKIFSTTLVLTVLGSGAVSVGLAQKPSDEHVAGRLLVQHAATASDSVVGRFGGRVDHKIDRIGVSVLEVPEPALDAVTRALERTGLFTFVEPDHNAHGSNDSQWPVFRPSGI